MEFWDTITKRRSVREFSPRPVDREVIEKLLYAAIAAPSSMNSQPCRFHVCTGKSRIELGEIVSQATVHLIEYIDVLGQERYEEAVGWFSSFGEAPVVVGVSAPYSASESESDVFNKLLSVGAAVENLMLAATAEGLGTCCVTFAWWVRDELAELFGIGDDRKVVSLIVLGHPGDTAPVAPPKREDVVDWLG